MNRARLVALAILVTSCLSVDLAAETVSPATIIDGRQTGAGFGESVATGGDVNGDGYSDLIVGSPRFDNGEEDEGGAFLYLGSAQGLQQSAAWSVEGDQAGALLGTSVASAGDVNGDGFGDVIVGAPGFENGQPGEGRVYVYLGSASGLDRLPAWTGEGEAMGAAFGRAVATAGDVDDDGFAEVLIGASGSAFLFAGGASFDTRPDGTPTNADWTVQRGGGFGAALSTAGDVNADGYDDVVVGAPGGRAFLYLGSISGLPTTETWMWEFASTSFGHAVSTAGDANGDGFADVLIGELGLQGVDEPGQTFLFLGSAADPPVNSIAAWSVTGEFPSPAGDVNGDGLADLIVGSPASTGGQAPTFSGETSLYIGTPDGPGTVPLWTVLADQPEMRLGRGVYSAGDVNGDGYGDVVVSAPTRDTLRPDDGRLLVFHGGGVGPADPPDWTESSVGLVAGAGDVDGDGYSDVIVRDFASSRLYLGSPSGLSDTAAWTGPGGPFIDEAPAAGDVNGDGYGDVVFGDFFGGDEVRLHLGGPTGDLGAIPAWTAPGNVAASAGDVNGDGYGDLIVGEWDTSVAVYLGAPTGPSTTAVWTAPPPTAGRFLVRSAGDVNGDGFSDVLIGGPGFPEEDESAGEALVYAGSSTGIGTDPIWRDRQGPGYVRGIGSAGDVNGDGYSDLIVGAVALRFIGGGVQGQETAEVVQSRAFVYLGSPFGPSSDPSWITETDAESVEIGPFDPIGESLGLVGIDVGTAGDVNGDGFDDVIVGGPCESLTEGQGPALFCDTGGQALVFLGSSSGLSDVPIRLRGSEPGFGASVAGAGDVNGDGFGDVIAGGGFGRSATATVYLGNAGDGAARRPRQLRLDRTPIGPLGLSDAGDSVLLELLVNTPAGRGDARLAWEVQPRGTPFEGSSVERSDFIDTGAPGTETAVTVRPEGLSSGTLYQWRARVETNSVLFPASPWFSPGFAGARESKFGTAGVRAAPLFRAISPAPGQTVFRDDPPPILSWLPGSMTEFTIEWSRNPGFNAPMVSVGGLQALGGIGTYTPDVETWRRVLALGQELDFRGASVFWRIVALAGGGSPSVGETRVIRVLPAASPEPRRPEEGELVPFDIVPVLEWTRAHNERFEVRFATTRAIGDDRVVAGEGYALEIGTEVSCAQESPVTDVVLCSWTVPDSVWSDVLGLRDLTSDGIVYWVVLARDLLGRNTFSRVRSLQIEFETGSGGGAHRIPHTRSQGQRPSITNRRNPRR